MKANNTKISGFSLSGSTGSGYAGIHLYNSNDCTIENNKLSNNAAGIFLWYANSNNILSNTATGNGDYGGILLQASTFNTVSGNNVFNNKRGVFFGTSSDNKLSGNTVKSSTGDWGLFVCGRSPRSLIYNNYFNETNMSIKQTISGSPDTLNVAKTAGPNIVGGPSIGGNYWGRPDGTGFSQTAIDKDGDGFSDSPYANATGGPYTDNLPLVIPGPVSVLPVADFTSNVTSGNAPLNVGFTNTSTGSPTSWNWSFGDGTANSTAKNPTHTYSAAGSYNVSLTVTNGAGSNTVTKSNYITVTVPAPKPQPVANFTSNVTSGPSPLTVQFNSTSTNASSLSWNFGDGTAAVSDSPVHTFTNTGASAQTFTVTLKATNQSVTSTKTGTITVNPAASVKPPVAAFTISPASGGTTSTTYTFTDNSTNSPTSWSWNFGDGQNATGKTVTHIYASAKTYTVTLTAGNKGGNSTTTKSVVVGSSTVKPIASFTVSPASGGTTATTYTFTDTSKNAPNSWSWDFGDRTTLGTASSATHKYSRTGTYTVKLTVKNGAGSAYTTKSVVVGAAPKAPVASFTYAPSTVKKGTAIKFTDTSTNTPKKWKWTFSDNGATVTTKTASHVFSKAGTFKVSLTASNDAGNGTTSKTITVK